MRIPTALAIIYALSIAPCFAWAHGSGGPVPVVTPTTLNGSQPATNGQNSWFAVSGVTRSTNTITVSNGPTSCNITAGNGAGDLAISSTGVISVTSQGATDLAGASDLTTYNLTVTCSNGSGTSSPAAITVNVYTDGSKTCSNAASAGQYPNLFAADSGNNYVTRPPWAVAGVDYAVGPSATPTTDWTTLSISGVSVNVGGRLVTVSGNNVTINGVDFSGGHTAGGNQAQVFVTGSNVTLTNNTLASAASPNSLALRVSGTNGTISNNTVIGSGNVNIIGAADVVLGDTGVGGTYTLNCNRMENATSQTVSLQPGANAGLTDKFNIYGNAGAGAVTFGFHGDYLETEAANGLLLSPISTKFNMTRQTLSDATAGTQGFAHEINTEQPIYSSLNHSFNVHTCRPSSGNCSLNIYTIYAYDQTSDSPIVSNNYIDNALIGGTINIPKNWCTKNSNGGAQTGGPAVLSGNIQLTTGSALNSNSNSSCLP